MLGFNMGDDRKIALDYLKANGVTFPNILDSSEAVFKVMQQYNTLGMIGGVPMTYVIDKEGKIVLGWYGYESGAHEKAFAKLGLDR